MNAFQEAELFKPLLLSLIQKVSKIPIQRKKKAMMQVKKFPALNLAVDILGLPQAMYVTKADVTDRNGTIEMVIATSDNFTKVQNMLVDCGYSGFCQYY